ncbi:30S ribosomal protein S3, partial [human gut metagenome]
MEQIWLELSSTKKVLYHFKHLRANIDYGFAEANTTYGKVGVKVWIYKGEVLPAKKNSGRRRAIMPLMPKRTKYRKQQKGRNRGKATRGNVVT